MPNISGHHSLQMASLLYPTLQLPTTAAQTFIIQAKPNFVCRSHTCPTAMAISSSQQPVLTDVLSRADRLPSHYIRPISDRPNLEDVKTSDISIPLIDLQGVDGPDRSKIVQAIGRACQTDVFFQVKNHGIPQHVIDDMLHVAKEFFRLPESEKLKNYSEDPLKSTHLSTSFNVKEEKVSNWGDYLRLHCYPLENYINEGPSNPPSLK